MDRIEIVLIFILVIIERNKLRGKYYLPHKDRDLLDPVWPIVIKFVLNPSQSQCSAPSQSWLLFHVKIWSYNKNGETIQISLRIFQYCVYVIFTNSFSMWSGTCSTRIPVETNMRWSEMKVGDNLLVWRISVMRVWWKTWYYIIWCCDELQ